MLRRFPTTPSEDLGDRLKRNRSLHVSDADFKSSVDIFRATESCQRFISARHLQILCASVGPSADHYMLAVARIISEYKENLDRPERELCDTETEELPVVSSSGDSTLNSSSDVPENNPEDDRENKNTNVFSLVPYPSDSESE